MPDASWENTPDSLSIELIVDGQRRASVSSWSCTKTGEFFWANAMIITAGGAVEFSGFPQRGLFDSVAQACAAVEVAILGHTLDTIEEPLDA